MRRIYLGILILVFLFIPMYAVACPECGCWEQWVSFAKRSYLEQFNRFPRREKIINLDEYELYLTAIQISPQLYEMFVYAQNPHTRKPYVHPKNISVYKQVSGGWVPYSEITDNETISRFRWVNPEPTNYLFKIYLQGDAPPLCATASFIFGIPGPDITYLIVLGVVVFIVLALVIFRKYKTRTINNSSDPLIL